jgi:hypothetical protein
MRTLDHENLNRFLGVSISGNIAYFLWDFCERGNIIVSLLGWELTILKLSRSSSLILLALTRLYFLELSGTFLRLVIYDINLSYLKGLHYIHNSFGQYGCLSAYNCVVGDRFDVRIQDYGSSAVKSRTFRRQDSKCEFNF